MKRNRLLRILISRTDSIGDVVLTLPVAFALKQRFPNATIGFLGKQYTQPVISACPNVDEFVDLADFLDSSRPETASGWDAIIHVFPVKAIAMRAREAGIPWRVGTTNRFYHWTTCNSLVRLSRKNSDLHEAQLNLKLLKPFGIKWLPSLQELAGSIRLGGAEPLLPDFRSLLAPHKFHLILHPKSQGSAREWGQDNFRQLIELLPQERYQLFISGTAKEGEELTSLLEETAGRAVDITGKMSLAQFIAFIAACDGLVAASTGPLHIAAGLGRVAIGIYPSDPTDACRALGPYREKGRRTDRAGSLRRLPQKAGSLSLHGQHSAGGNRSSTGAIPVRRRLTPSGLRRKQTEPEKLSLFRSRTVISPPKQKPLAADKGRRGFEK